MKQELSTTKTRSPEAEDGAPSGPEQHPTLRPSIWVASLLDHEYTVHHGAWIDADQSLAGIRASINNMLAASPVAEQTGARADRWAIFYHYDFAGYRVNVHESLARISQLGRGLTQHGPAFAAWAEVAPDDCLDSFDAAFLGHYDDLRSYLEQRINDLGYDELVDRAVPASLRPYVKIDIAATALDMQYHGDLRTVPAQHGGIWVFNG